jgi:diguanylate cyclase
VAISGEMHQVQLWSRQALEHLMHDGLTPTPQNYTVYYHYYSGGISALNAAYNSLAAGGKISQQQCDELYNKYVVADGQIAFLRDANEVIDREIKKVMELLSQSAKGAGQFGENLDQFSGQLNTQPTVETLRNLVNKIAAETQVIAAQNQKLQGDLAVTTDQLSDMRNKFERIHKESQIDSLTEVGNRKFFDQQIINEMIEAREKDLPLSLLMVDIDHFKKFNDSYGHLIGDQVLRLVARTMIENLKGKDIIARYGGEEFAILLPQTRVQDAERVANQLRVTLATKQIKKRESNEILGAITISIGATEYITGEDKDEMISRADEALYKAKQTGRNKVVCTGLDNNKKNS